MTSVCRTCGHAKEIFSHRPFAHTNEVRHYCGCCGKRVEDYRPGPKGLGKVTMTREPRMAPTEATHPVQFYPAPRGAKRLYLKGRDEPQPAEDGMAFNIGSCGKP